MKSCVFIVAFILFVTIYFEKTCGNLSKRNQVKYKKLNLFKRYFSSKNTKYLHKREDDGDDSDLTEVTLDTNYARQINTMNGLNAEMAITGQCGRIDHSETRWIDWPLWYIDMEQERLIAKVNVGVKKSSHSNRFNEAYLRVLEYSPSMGQRSFSMGFCGYFKGPADSGETVTFYCGQKGKFLAVSLEGNSKKLEMCKLKVYEVPNAKEQKIEVNPRYAQQIGTGLGREAFRAITGNCEDNQHSETEWAPWPIWFINLKKTYRVTKVQIGARNHAKAARLREVHVEMHSSKPQMGKAFRQMYWDGCAYFKGPASPGQLVILYCGKKGQYLSVKVQSSQFYSSVEMCRVKFFGALTDGSSQEESASSQEETESDDNENNNSDPADSGEQMSDESEANGNIETSNQSDDGQESEGQAEETSDQELTGNSKEHAKEGGKIEAMSEAVKFFQIGWITFIFPFMAMIVWI